MKLLTGGIDFNDSPINGIAKSKEIVMKTQSYLISKHFENSLPEVFWIKDWIH